MTRIPGWEEALVRAIEAHAALPFAWGASDCGYLATDCIGAITGKVPFKTFRGYRTETGAAKKLLKAGFDDIGDLFASAYDAIPPALAQRGDVGTIERDGKVGAAVVTSFGVAIKTEHGVGYEPITALSRAFRIG
ncbi:DUF6950 family protein [Aurantimonas endophytica]|uniref:DUF6950 domain-containing protein n=1 Tax=Aurantimonas endophytica TaxID=1522175 RepID=A0A7W6HAE8_9HYPH|nr:hypothetical protein [Aurantimonas endophytica]MBB4001599.1 hypothetical protein [Aurantimonas endophytica]MCO6402762.1 hypothetical protein [Aurantimonas endophytica]